MFHHPDDPRAVPGSGPCLACHQDASSHSPPSPRACNPSASPHPITTPPKCSERKSQTTNPLPTIPTMHIAKRFGGRKEVSKPGGEEGRIFKVHKTKSV
ncbi:hypothetical protein BT63DRAFT_420122 [Microthyrium microscopicum]|uniref:Uncharacterized protein n=1 Tax=Microthyrium microscopicum TaxID=703497 RepID=A0A6A6USW8_9PEZI|nr:hypothetical protein BT63DRAFT_420122 [Microthyrium microscopicum]